MTSSSKTDIQRIVRFAVLIAAALFIGGVAAWGITGHEVPRWVVALGTFF
jgi:hypothetical protein